MRKNLTRRDFAKGGIVAAAVATMGLAGCTSESAPKSESDNSSKAGVENYKVSETVDTDIVVVGSGTAGTCAAISAAQAGAKVIVLEKLSSVGGNANAAAGILCCNSEVQKANGTTQDPMRFVESANDWHKMNIDINQWKAFAQATGENLDWCRNLGVQVIEQVPGMTFVYVENASDFEPMKANADGTLPEADMSLCDHASGSYAVAVRNKAMDELGVSVKTDAGAVELVMDGNRVVGVIAGNEKSGYAQYNAKAVILACGSMAASPEMIAKLTNEDPSRLEYRGFPGATGDGHNLALSAGGYSTGNYALGKEGLCIAGTALDSSVNMVGAMQGVSLFVNQDCERFVNEDHKDYGQLGNLPLMQGRSYAIIDSSMIERYQKDGLTFGFADMVEAGKKYDNIAKDFESALKNNSDYVKSADTLEDLAKELNLDPSKLTEAVNAYNGYCEAGEDPEYGKDVHFLMPIGTAPYYGMELHSNIMNALGGIRTNKNMQCVTPQFEAIPGLYAAGTEVEGFESKTYEITLPGTCQAICIHTGRIAGTHAAKNMQS